MNPFRNSGWSLLVGLLACGWVCATENVGKVVDVKGDVISIQPDEAITASAGDRVEIYFQIQGVPKPFEVAVAQVTGMQGELILAKVTEELGRPAVNQLARLFATAPKNPPDPSTPGLAVPGGGLNLVGHAWGISSVAFVANGKQAWTTGEDFRLWDLATGVVIRRIEIGEEKPLCFAVTPDGRQAVAGYSDNSIRLWDLENGHEVRRFPGHSTWAMCVAVSPDGRQVLSGAGEVGLEVPPTNPNGQAIMVRKDCTVRLWDIESGREMSRMTGHQATIKSVAFSPDGRRALSASTDRTTRLWDLESGRQIGQFNEPRPMGMLAVAFSPDGQRCLTASGGSPDVEEDPQPFGGNANSQLTAPAKDSFDPSALPPSDDFGQDGFALRLWDIATGRQLQSFKGHSREIEGIAFLPDGKRILTGSYDRTVRLWDTESGSELACFTGHEMSVGKVAVEGGGRMALSGDGSGSVWLWPLAPDQPGSGGLVSEPAMENPEGLPTNGAWLGATFGDVDETLAALFDLDDVSGAVVIAVAPGSLADRFGLKKRDVIRLMGGTGVTSAADMAHQLGKKAAGEVVAISLIRGGQMQQLKIKLEPAPIDRE